MTNKYINSKWDDNLMDFFGIGSAGRQREYNSAEAEISRNWSAEQAQIQREYETQMSNTAYQRSMADMQKAGINPILAYANPASTPSAGIPGGATATSQQATNVNIADAINGTANLMQTIANINRPTTAITEHERGRENYNKRGEVIGSTIETIKIISKLIK